jgi:thioredoxin 1|uniref:Thioredoxin n=1 Tax=candidate division WOR-3 bacterium TaxID=2052148 RepID=A0A7C3UXZ1_UNCW3
MALEINKNNFSEVINSPLALVDFWAEWCQPCRMMTPIVEELAKEYEGKVKIGKVNVDNEPELAEKYGIMSIPAFLFFTQGKVADKVIGACPKEYLKEKIEKFLKGERK